MLRSDGRFELGATVDVARIRPAAPVAAGDPAEKRHLWVVEAGGVPCALERCAFAVDHGLAEGLIKHTNLTGGGRAHCGGELWFVERAGKILLNGFSGRYGPRSPGELVDAARALRGLGLEVGYVPWSEELNRFPIATDGVEDIEWLE